MNRGEIWFFDFKNPDKSRPVVILTRQEMIRHLNTVTIAPMTRTIRGVPSEVVLGPEEGLKDRSAVNLHHLMTVPRSGLSRFVATLPPAKLEEIGRAMLFALGFDEV